MKSLIIFTVIPAFLLLELVHATSGSVAGDVGRTSDAGATDSEGTGLCGPAGCIEWFDGCNVCTLGGNGQCACTEIGCPPGSLEEPECREYAPECCHPIQERDVLCRNIKRTIPCEAHPKCVWDCDIPPPDQGPGCCVGPPDRNCRDTEIEADCGGGCQWRDNCEPQEGHGPAGLEIVIINGDDDDAPLSVDQRQVANSLKSITVAFVKGFQSIQLLDKAVADHKAAKWFWSASDIFVPGLGTQNLDEDADYYDAIISFLHDMGGAQANHNVQIIVTTEVDPETGHEVINCQYEGTFRWEENPDVFIPFPANEDGHIEIPVKWENIYTHQEAEWKCMHNVYNYDVYMAVEAGWMNQFRMQAMSTVGKKVLLGMKAIKAQFPAYNVINVVSIAVGGAMILSIVLSVCVCKKCLKSKAASQLS